MREKGRENIWQEQLSVPARIQFQCIVTSLNFTAPPSQLFDGLDSVDYKRISKGLFESLDGVASRYVWNTC